MIRVLALCQPISSQNSKQFFERKFHNDLSAQISVAFVSFRNFWFVSFPTYVEWSTGYDVRFGHIPSLDS